MPEPTSGRPTFQKPAKHLPTGPTGCSQVTLSLKDIERQQISRIARLTSDAEDKASAMQDIIRQAGLKIDESGTDDVGGPYADPQRSETDPFNLSLTNLDNALNRLDIVKESATALPFGNPAPGRTITSRSGNRMDPFLGRPALHTGIDFRAETGADVKATGAGKVTVAENSGGYGNMVEIDHGQGVSTRFGHLSAILVGVGESGGRPRYRPGRQHRPLDRSACAL